ncbi:MAG: type II toxin-antitoxin system VapC family toxin [Gammaproteobacteria bacterium]|nr:type II toxin-antitoxin system VapC family toxin [Gammaproteobacteria bacterium]
MTAPLASRIDTNVVSEMMRPMPEPGIAAFLDSIADEDLGLSAISVWEILDGIGRLPARSTRDSLADRFHDLLDETVRGQDRRLVAGRRSGVCTDHGR